MSSQLLQGRVATNVQFGKGGRRVRDNTVNGRMEMRNAADTGFVRCAGLPAVDPEDFLTFAQFQAQSRWIDPVVALSLVDVPPTGNPGTIDGIAVNNGDRVALSNQTNPVENGVWIVNTGGAWTRPGDFPTGGEAANRTFMVQQGTSVQAESQWTVSTDPPNDVIDTDPLTLVQIAGPGSGVTSLTSTAGDVTLIPAPGAQTGAVTISALTEGLGIQIGGGAGASAATITAEVIPNPAGAGLSPVLSNAAGAATVLRKFVSAGATVTITIDGDGNLNFEASGTGTPYTQTLFVDPAGLGANSGFEANNPTDIDTALATANANGNTTIFFADGVYTAAAPIVITGDGVRFAGLGTQTLGAQQVQITNTVQLDAPNFSASDVAFQAAVTDNNGANRYYENSNFEAGYTVVDPSGDLIRFNDCVVNSFNTTGTSGTTNSYSFTGSVIGVFGNPSLVLGHGGTGSVTVQIQDALEVGDVEFGQSSTATAAVLATSVQRMSAITDSGTPPSSFLELRDVSCSSINMPNSAGGNVNLSNVIVGALGNPSPIVTGAGISEVILDDVIFDRQTSSIANEASANDFGTADDIGADFSAAKIQTTQLADPPRVLVQDPANGNLVQYADASIFGLATPYTQTLFVDPAGLAANSGFEANAPTDIDTALATANANGNTTIFFSDGVYTASAPIVITGDGVRFAGLGTKTALGANQVEITNTVQLDAPDFVASDINFQAAVTDNNGSNRTFENCRFESNFDLVGPGTDELDFTNCIIVGAFNVSGASAGTSNIDVYGGELIGGFNFTHSGTGIINTDVVGCANVGPASLNHSSTGALSYRVYNVPVHGEISDGVGAINTVEIRDVQVGAVSLSNGGAGSSLSVVDTRVGSALGTPAAINAGAGYDPVVVSNTVYDQTNSTIANPTQPTDAATADQFSPEFLASAKIRLTPFTDVNEPNLLVSNANTNELVQALPASSLFVSYSRTIFVDPLGIPGPANDGRNPARPTDWASAVAAANTIPGVLIVLAAGTYSDGDGVATGTATFTNNNTRVVSRDGPGSAIIDDNVIVNNVNGFELAGVTLGAALGNAIAFTDSSDVRIDQVVQNGGVFLIDGANIGQGFNITDSDLQDLTMTGSPSASVVMEGGRIRAGSPSGGLITSFSSEGNVGGTFLGLTEIGGVSLGHSGSGSFLLSLLQIGRIGLMADSVNARTQMSMEEVRSVDGFDFSSSTAPGGRLFIRDVSVQSALNNLVQPMLVSAAYTNGTYLHNVRFDRETSNFNGTEVTANNAATADENGADFSVAKIQTEQNDAAPQFLVQDPANENLVEYRDAATVQTALSAGQGIDADELASDVVATRNVTNGNTGSGVAGVPLIISATFAGQGDGTVTVGPLPDNARVTQTKLLISSAAAAGNANLGYNGGTGIELQNGAVANDVTIADTYEVTDLIPNTAGAQDVELVFSGMTGTVDGEVMVEYYILEAP